MTELDITQLNDVVREQSLRVQAAATEIRKVIVGQPALVDRLLIALLCRGHLLVEGVPGLAKTLAIKTFSRVLDLSFSRIQFTPDLLPADLVGTLVFQPKSGEFTVRKGPVFAHLVLADEINRAPAKVQSALLEAMQERQVTIGDTTYPLPEPFLVFATQNPIEQEGTYPLPEAQLDRFMFQITVDYPGEEDEVAIVNATTSGAAAQVEKVLAPERILELQALVRRVPAPDHVVRQAVRLVRASRPGPTAPEFVRSWVRWGAGPRASQHLVLGAKARAVLHGRYAASSEDILALARPVLQHRLITNFHADAEGVSSRDVVERLAREIPA